MIAEIGERHGRFQDIEYRQLNAGLVAIGIPASVALAVAHR